MNDGLRHAPGVILRLLHGPGPPGIRGFTALDAARGDLLEVYVDEP